MYIGLINNPTEVKLCESMFEITPIRVIRNKLEKLPKHIGAGASEKNVRHKRGRALAHHDVAHNSS